MPPQVQQAQAAQPMDAYTMAMQMAQMQQQDPLTKLRELAAMLQMVQATQGLPANSPMQGLGAQAAQKAFGQLGIPASAQNWQQRLPGGQFQNVSLANNMNLLPQIMQQVQEVNKLRQMAQAGYAQQQRQWLGIPDVSTHDPANTPLGRIANMPAATFDTLAPWQQISLLRGTQTPNYSPQQMFGPKAVPPPRLQPNVMYDAATGRPTVKQKDWVD